MKVGDLLIQKSNGKEHVGLIIEIEARSGLGSSCVRVEWTGEIPVGYWHEHGYSCLNIGNQSHVFKVIEA